MLAMVFTSAKKAGMIEQLELFHSGLLALLAFLFGLPYLRLSPSFYYTQEFYTHEESVC